MVCVFFEAEDDFIHHLWTTLWNVEDLGQVKNVKTNSQTSNGSCLYQCMLINRNEISSIRFSPKNETTCLFCSSILWASLCILLVSLQFWIWHAMYHYIGHYWNCWEPFPPAQPWFLCCCLSLETRGRTRRRRMNNTLRDRLLLGCYWPRWRHVWTRIPIASGEMEKIHITWLIE